MAKVQRKNLKICQGSTYIHTFAITHEDGTAYDLTGFSARMQIRQTIDAITPELDVTDADPELEVIEVDSEVKLTLSAAVTAAWTFTEAVYDIEVFQGSFVKRVVKGSIQVDKEVTR